MGQGQSLVTLHVMNCSNSALTLKYADGSTHECRKSLGMKVFRYVQGFEFEILKDGKCISMQRADSDVLIYLNAQGLKVSRYPLETAFKRPFWLIAHGVNQSRELRTILDAGANAAEVDVIFDAEKKSWLVSHDENNSDAGSVKQWLEDAKYFCDRLLLVILDIKSACQSAQLGALLDQIRKAKFKSAIILSVPADLKCLLSVARKLTPNQGLATDFLNIDENVMKELPEDANIWYGNGIASFLPKPDLFTNIQDAVFFRDEKKKIKKVYCWTLASSYSISTYLDTNLDGIIVEQDFIQTARRIVDQYPFVKIATPKDNPFQKSELTCKILQNL